LNRHVPHILLCTFCSLLAVAQSAPAESLWVLWQNVTVMTTDIDGSNLLSTTKWGTLGLAEPAKECLGRLERIIRGNRADGAVHVKSAIVELDGLMTAVVRFVCIPDGSDPRVPKVPS
jgi:hypothetical protein